MLRHRLRRHRRDPARAQPPVRRARRGAELRAAEHQSVRPADRPRRRLNAGNKIGGASLRAKWDVGPGTLTSVTAWRFWDWKPENDRDFTGLPIVTASNNPSQQDQYTQEFRYNYTGDTIDFVPARSPSSSGSTRRALESRAPPRAAGPDRRAGDTIQPRRAQRADRQQHPWLKNTSAALFGQVELEGHRRADDPAGRAPQLRQEGRLLRARGDRRAGPTRTVRQRPTARGSGRAARHVTRRS